MYCSFMATTTISISSDAYEALKRLKQDGQSFSDVILSIVPKPKPRTCGELLKSLKEFEGVRLFDPRFVRQVREGRGRRSKGSAGK